MPNKAEKKRWYLESFESRIVVEHFHLIWGKLTQNLMPQTQKHKNQAIFSQLYMGKPQFLQNSHIIWQIYVPTFWIVNSWSISLSPGKTGCQKPKIRKKQKGKLKSRILPKKTFLQLINQIKTVESLSNWLGWYSSSKILFNH